ncbi:leucine-rich repeat-containing protein 72 isoform X3 [Gallus gallus]|uniref:leucine-rich repeat-containing protein 72 isoform X3 n=1 Tax=Gallus gallus TaxID=9031 RepID=UPI001AE6A830|nr:leucine-rich repeat-containing protein 72 isoform X3 [Gallus gallus]
MCYNVMTYVGSCAEKCTVYCQAVEKQLKICGFKRNVDVLVLYLAGLGLRSIPSLSLFRRLRYLWINNNKALKSKEKWPADYKFDKDGEMPFYMTGVCKSHTTLHKIQDLSFLKKNYCLTELYLNNNELTDISGALKNLHSLQILLLHNNQLKQLGETVKELKGIISLRTLNLFYNPLAYDAGYRLYVIHSLPSVQLLDRKLTQRERELAFPVYNCEKSCAVESIAFGKTVDTSPGTAIRHSRDTQPARRLMVPPDWEFGNHTNKVPFENPEDAVLLRAMTRSVMEFSSIDWNKIPTCQERWLKHKAEEPPEKLTIQFR